MIVVKGKMPKCCGTCEASGTGACGIWMKNKDLQTIAQDCPIVGEIPDEHGDLIDASAFKKRNKDARMEKKLKNGAIQIIELDDIFAYFIAKEPVILEASE